MQAYLFLILTLITPALCDTTTDCNSTGYDVFTMAILGLFLFAAGVGLGMCYGGGWNAPDDCKRCDGDCKTINVRLVGPFPQQQSTH